MDLGFGFLRRSTSCVLQSSQVPVASLYTCHGLITPLALHNLALTIALLGLRRRYKPRQLEFAIFGAITTLQEYGTPYGLYNSLSTLHVGCSIICKKNHSVFFTGKYSQSTISAQRARLDTGGWLDLPRQGFSPGKMQQAFLSH